MPNNYPPRGALLNELTDRVVYLVRAQRRASRPSSLLDPLPEGPSQLTHISGPVDTPTMPLRRHVTATGFHVHLPADGALPETDPERLAEVCWSSRAASPTSSAPGEDEKLAVEATSSMNRAFKRERSHSIASLPSTVLVEPRIKASPGSQDNPNLEQRDESADLDALPPRKRARKVPLSRIPCTRSRGPILSAPDGLPLRRSMRIRAMYESKGTLPSPQPTAVQKSRLRRTTRNR